jgi:WD40 repeat protein
VLATIQLDGNGLSVRMSPTDPAVVFVGGAGGLLLKWNTATGTRTPLTGHQDDVYGLCVSDDGKLLASGSDDQIVRLWDTATGRCLWTSKQAHYVRSCAMHGSMVFCGVSGSNTVGLRKSDGTAGPIFAKANSGVHGLAVTRGEHAVLFSLEERSATCLFSDTSSLLLFMQLLFAWTQLQVSQRRR